MSNIKLNSLSISELIVTIKSDVDIKLNTMISVLRNKAIIYSKQKLILIFNIIKDRIFKKGIYNTSLSKFTIITIMYLNLGILDDIDVNNKKEIIPGVTYSYLSINTVLMYGIKYILFLSSRKKIYNKQLKKLLFLFNFNFNIKTKTKINNIEIINILLGYLCYGKEISYRNIITNSDIINKILIIKKYNLIQLLNNWTLYATLK